MKRFNVGKYMKETKAKKAKILMETEKIKGLDEEMRIDEDLKKRKESVEAKKKEMRAKEEQLNRLCTKVNHIDAVL